MPWRDTRTSSCSDWKKSVNLHGSWPPMATRETRRAARRETLEATVSATPRERPLLQPYPGTRMLLHHPSEKPAHVPAAIWKGICGRSGVAMTARERRAHLSTIALSTPKTRGMIMDGVGASYGNGVEMRFYRC
eukprot:TRINITY_DN2317_c0_g1_i2.p1 TRINITY_DN2317_c0_g1~~TRINITY_DN2317_c0_g1_i2.p1  ORF type:complete len:134 (+),score=12.22 TRINITY_DN2317_c0_g1_i2:217-618(+)